MTITIPLLILCLQTINMAVSWDLKTPLILNKKGDEIFFPRYVEKTKGNLAIAYVDTNEISTKTYTFCKDSTSSSNELSGILLENSATRICSSEKNHSYRELRTDNYSGKTISCGSSKDGYKYWMKYKLEIDNIPYTHILYEYCYDEKNSKRILYARYDIDNVRLLANELLKDEQNYVFELEKPSEEEAEDIEISKAYDKQSDYTPELVAIPEFIPFAHRKRSFYQWHNVAPMNRDLVKPWKLFLNRFIPIFAEETYKPMQIYSGTYEVRRVNGLTQYLPDGKTEIPLFWWIVVYTKDKKQGTSFIMENYAYGLGEKKREPLCGNNTFENVKINEAIPKGEGYDQASIYSCSPDNIDSITKIFKDYEFHMHS